MQKLTDKLSALTFDEIDTLFHKLKTESSFTYKDIEVSRSKAKIGKAFFPTNQISLETERIRKNHILKSSVGKTVKVKGLISDARLYDNSAIFCLSPCLIDDIDIGHTWTRYSPSFKNIKLNSTVWFYSKIKRYGELNNKSGVDWEEVALARTSGGNNSPLHEIPLTRTEISYAKGVNSNIPVLEAYEKEISVIPSKITLRYEYSKPEFKRFNFQDNQGVKISYHTFDRELVFNSKYAIKTSTQNEIDKLLFFEWLTKISDWEFWGYINHTVRI